MSSEKPAPAGEAGAKPASGTQPARAAADAGWWRKAVFLLAGAACVTPWVSAAGGLAIGMALALLGLTAYAAQGKKLSRTLIQAGVVLLGFSIPLQDVARAGTTGLAFAAGTIVLVFALGWLLGTWLRTEQRLTALLSAGTAICGGSAIAATGAVISASAAQISVATATVFLLNAGGVYAYPLIGQALGLSQEQFGAWAAVGIHDVAGVVAAGKAYGDVALQQATVIKLTRVLWIVPVALALAWWVRRVTAAEGKRATGTPVPWFVGLFVLACLARTLVPALGESQPWLAGMLGEGLGSPAAALKAASKAMLGVALFLIGASLSPAAVRAVGWRPLAQGVLMWLAVSVVALLVVRATVA